MDMAYVRSRGDEGRWMASLLHESQERGWLEEYERGWIIGSGASNIEVRYRLPYDDGLDTYADKKKETDKKRDDRRRKDFRQALGATHEIEIEPDVQVELPFWIADRPSRLVFDQELSIQMSIKSLAEYPDVQAWIDFLNRRHARIIESRRGLEAKMPAGEMERLKDNGFPEVCPAKELAAAMLLREGHVIACQTDTAAAVLTLGPSCGSDVFRAKAAVCGDGPLAKGDQLHRTVIPDQFYAPDRKPRHQIIGTIVEVG